MRAILLFKQQRLGRNCSIWAICLLALLSSFANGEIPLHEKQADFNDNNNNNNLLSTQRRLKRSKRQIHSKIGDVFLCMGCALGWTVWLISTRRDDPEIWRFQHLSTKKVMGHVIDVTLGEDADGTGIPVYHAVVDYSIATEDQPIQVRKCFETRTHFEEGFLNAELLVLSEDPTMSVILQDYLEDVAQRKKEPQRIWLQVGIWIVAALLIGTSFWGASHAVLRLDADQKPFGWLSVAFGALLLWPLSLMIYTTITVCFRLAGLQSERPGTIIHGANHFECKHLGACDANLDPFEVFEQDHVESPIRETLWHPNAHRQFAAAGNDPAAGSAEQQDLKEQQVYAVDNLNCSSVSSMSTQSNKAGRTQPSSGMMFEMTFFNNNTSGGPGLD
jgi:hypothetical protein